MYLFCYLNSQLAEVNFPPAATFQFEMDVKAKKTLRIQLKNEKKGELIRGNVHVILRNVLQPDKYVAILRQLQSCLVEISKYGMCVSAVGLMLISILIYHVILMDFGYLFHRICTNVIPLFSIASAFYCVALYFRKSWDITDIYVLFCACFVGEFFAQCTCVNLSEQFITRPSLFFIVLLSVSIASIFSPLESTESVYVIGFISFIRLLSCTSLIDLPQSLRPFLAYLSGILGVITAKYMETTLAPPSEASASVPSLSSAEVHDRVPAIRRRRSSAMPAVQSLNISRGGRRTSLPALSLKQVMYIYSLDKY